MSGEGTSVTRNGWARAVDGTDQYPFGGVLDPGGVLPKPLPLNTYNFLPAEVTLLHVLLAG